MRLVFLAIVFVCLFGKVFSIFEDQAGHIDWKKDVLGPVSAINTIQTEQAPSGIGLILFSELTNDISMLDKKSGNLIWHRVAPSSFVSRRSDIISINRRDAISFVGGGVRGSLDIILFAESDEVYELIGIDSGDGAIIWNTQISKSGNLIGVDYVKLKGTGLFIIIEDSSVRLLDCRTKDIVINKQYKIKDAAVIDTDIYLNQGSIVTKLSAENFKEATVFQNAAVSESFLIGDKTNLLLLARTKKDIVSFDILSGEAKSLTGSLSFVSKSVHSLKGSSFSLKPTKYLIAGDFELIKIAENKVSSTKLTSSSQVFVDPSSSEAVVLDERYIYEVTSASKLNLIHEMNSNIRYLWSLNGYLYFSTVYENFIAYSLKSKQVKFEIPTYLSKVIGNVHMIDNSGILNEGALSSNREILSKVLNLYEQGKLSQFNLELWFLRLADQVDSFIGVIAELYLSLLNFFGDIFSTKGTIFIDLYRGNIDIVHYTVQEKRNFGFLRKIILLSETGMISSLNSETGNIVDTVMIKDFEAADFIESFALASSLPQKIIFFFKTRALVYDPQLNSLSTLKEFKKKVLVVLKPKDSIDDFFIVFEDNSYQVLADNSLSEHLTASNLADIHFVLPQENESIISGYRTKKDPFMNFVEEYFRIALPVNNKLQGIYSQEDTLINSVGRNVGNGKLMAKFVASSVVTIISTDPFREETFIQVVNLKTGGVIKSLILESCETDSINSISFENNILISCFSMQYQRTEILSISLFYDYVFEKYELNPIKASTDLILESLEEILVEVNSFFFTKRIKSMSITTSKQGITEKQVLFALNTGQIAAIDKRLLDPRRPKTKKLSKEEKEEGLIPYFPMIPFQAKTTINHRNNLIETDRIFSFKSNLESTSLMITLGRSIYFTRIQPSAGFDLMPQEFNYALLVFMVIGLLFAVSFLSNALRKKKLTEAWK